MSIDLTHGYIYILENKGTWVPTVGDIDLALFIEGEGTDFVKLQIPRDFKIRGKTGIEVVSSGGGSEFDRRPNTRGYAALANGIETTVANAMRVANFFMLDRHCSGASATFKAYYMVIVLFDGTYVPFINAASGTINYCPGRVLDWEVDWDEDDHARATVRLNWRSVM